MKKLITSFVALLIATATYAVPARPGWQTLSQPDGTTIQLQLMGDEFCHYWINRDGQVVQPDTNGYWQVLKDQPSSPAKAPKRMASAQLRPNVAKAPATGSPRGLVILVNFKDQTFQTGNNQSAMHDMMNADNYNYNGATGSVAKYFADQSDGQYTPIFDVIGPVTLPYNMSHYGANDSEGNDLLPGDMVVEACSIANELHDVDFTQYDNDHDGYLDFVYVIYAGKGEADGGVPNTIWPHSWDVYSAEYYGNCSYNESKRIFDGRYIYQYACSGELDGPTGERAGIGTIAHEFSHVIGMPDLYDIDYGQNYEDEMTPGVWHLMDHGSYNNDGRTPPNYTIYDKYFLGWLTPQNPGNTLQELTLAANEGYQIASSNSLLSATTTNTVYYIENRQASGWDAHLPGHGMLIWQVTYDQTAWETNAPNAEGGNLRYTIVSASGQTTKIGTAADPFPGSKGKTEWRGISSKPLLNITETDGLIRLTYIEAVDNDNWTYEVLYENATVSSEAGKVAKGGTLTLTVNPAAGYLLDETMIEVEENNTARSFTYSSNTLTISDVQGDLSIYIMPEEDPNAPDTPDNPEIPDNPDTPDTPDTDTLVINSVQYAEAYYYEYDGTGYFEVDIYNNYDYDTYEYIYPELYICIPAKSKTALNGTYDMIYAEYWSSANDSVEADFTTPATITFQHLDETNYAINGSFLALDGVTYIIDDTVSVWAYDYDNGVEITLNESADPDEPTNPEDPNDPSEPELTGTVIFDADIDKGNANFSSDNAGAYQVAKDGILLEVSEGIVGSSNNEMHYRIYKNQTLTLSSTIGNIVSVEFVCTASGDAKYGPGGFTTTDGYYTYEGTVGTWKGRAQQITFTASSNQVRITQIAVTIAGPTTDVEEILNATPTVRKLLRDGQLLIIHNDVEYNTLGGVVR